MPNTAVTRARRSAAAVVRRRSSRGAAAVEFALIVPILVMLLLGTVTTGLAYSDHLSITNATREGARFGSAVDYNASPTTWGDSVQSRVQQVYFNSGSTLSTSQICVQLFKASDLTTPIGYPTTQGSCGTAPDNPAVIPTNSCFVKVWVRKPAKILLGVFSIPQFNIGSRSVSFYQRTAGVCTAN
jgi:Flp pilus assembly protein TadG